MKRVWILLMLSLMGCGRGGERAEGEGPALPVTVTVATRQPVEERLRLLARIEASEEPLIVAETSGRVVAVHVEPGQAVEVGSLLVELDDRDQRLALERAEAQRERVEALILAQQRQVARLKNLARRDAASAQALEGAEAELAALQAQRRELDALIASSKLQLERTRITSPLAGTIDRRLVSVGDFLSPGKPVAAIIGRETRRVVVALPENQAPRLRPGLLLRLLPSEGPPIALTLASLRPAVTPAGRALEAIAFVAGEEGARLLPGARVPAELVLEERESFWLPALAVVERQQGRTVYVLEGERARGVLVETGVRREGFIEVRSGLSEGEKVIVEGAGFLSEGLRVLVREDAS